MKGSFVALTVMKDPLIRLDVMKDPFVLTGRDEGVLHHRCRARTGLTRVLMP